MDMEQLIESVRGFPCLWKTDDPEYKMPQLKETAWAEVAKDCGLPDVKEARIIWKRLRDGHRQARTRKKPSDKATKWKYEEQMEFLLPYMSNRVQQIFFTTSKQEVEVEQEDSSSDEEVQTEDVDAFSYVPDRIKEESNVKRRESRRAERVGKQMLLKTDGSNSVARKDSGIEKFFLSMCESTCQLPERLQLRVQRQIFDVVMDAKEAHLSS